MAIAAEMSIAPLACILDAKLVKQISLTEFTIDKIDEIQVSDFNMVIPKEFWNLLNTLMYISSLLENISSVTSCPKLFQNNKQYFPIIPSLQT